MEAGEIAIPFFEKLRLSASPWLIEPIPGLGRGQTSEILVGAGVVVPAAEYIELLVELLGISAFGNSSSDPVLESSEESLDWPVLPGRHRLYPLMPNSEPKQGKAEEPLREGRAIVRAQDLRLAVELDRVEQEPQNGDRGMERELAEIQASARAVIEYEPETGRVVVESSGGLLSESPLSEQRYAYEPALPWPNRIRFFEKVPGLSQLTETQSASYRRDALGRVVEEKRSDGSKVETIYDRLTGQPIKVTTGAGATSTVSYDGAGRQVRVTRPNDRGETLYAYDLDGRLRQEVIRTDSTDWATTYGYDAVGRPVRVDYQDGSFATTTWNSDSTVGGRAADPRRSDAELYLRRGQRVTFGGAIGNRPADARSTRPAEEKLATGKP